MKRLAIILLIISSFLTFATRASESELISERSSSIALERAYVPGELLVKYRPFARATASEYFRLRWSISTIRSFERIGVQHLKLPKDMTVEEGLEIFHNDPDVEYVEPNYLRYATATKPNDTFFSELWGLDNTGQNVNGSSGTSDSDIDAPEAWDITTGNSNVVVAVIDSGVDYNHPDFAGNIWANTDEAIGDANGDGFPGVQGVDDDGDGLIDEDSQGRQPGEPGYTNDLGDDDDENGYPDDIRGWDFVDDDNDPMDSDNHGTHVAGTIAAVGNNNKGITGVSWVAKIMPLRFLNAFGVGTDANAIRAIEYANAKGVHVINNSWGGGGFNQSLKDAIDASSAVVVCAAGNDGANNDAIPFYPARYTSSNIIAVAATDQSDSRAFFSNYGATSVDVAAPGVNVLSSRPDRKTLWSDNFDDGNINDWVTGGTNNTWDVTGSLSYSGSHSITESPSGGYQDNTSSWARAPVINLSSYGGAKLEFKLRGVSEGGSDFLYVQISTDLINWTDQGIYIGGLVYSRISGTTNNSWFTASVDLGLYDGNSAVHIRFLFTSDFSVTSDGWYIDDVSVTAADTTYSNGAADYQFLQGTSMATPHVAGLAALIWGLDLGQTYADIKQRVLNGVEVKSGLRGTILTEGRINAFNSVRDVPTSPSNLSGTAVSSSEINLSWSDNSYGEDGFKIERRKGASGIFSQIAVTPANTTSYSNTELDELTTYYYRVSAFRGVNTSDFSANTSVTTSATTTSSSSGGGGGGGGCFLGAASF